MTTPEWHRLPQSKLGITSCASFGLAVFFMIALNAILGNLALHQGTLKTYDSAVKPAFVSAFFTLYVDLPIHLLGIGLAITGLLRSGAGKTASWAGLGMNVIGLATLLACAALLSDMTGIK